MGSIRTGEVKIRQGRFACVHGCSSCKKGEQGEKSGGMGENGFLICSKWRKWVNCNNCKIWADDGRPWPDCGALVRAALVLVGEKKKRDGGEGGGIMRAECSFRLDRGVWRLDGF